MTKRSLNITITGTSAVIKKLELASAKTKLKINNAVHKQGLLLEAEIKQSIAGRKAEPKSVDTGDFLNSITTNNNKNFESTVSSRVDHAKYLEEGTSKIKPRRHFKNSASRLKPSIVGDINSSISSIT